METQTTTTGHETELATHVSEESSHEGGISALGIDAGLLITQVVNFLLLLIVLKFAVYGPIVKLLKERREKISSGLKLAEQSQIDAQAAAQRKEEIIIKAKAEAAKILENAQHKAVVAAQEIKEKAESEAEQVLIQAQEQIKREKSQILAEVEGELGQLVAKATEKVVGGSELEVSGSQIDSVLNDLKGA